MRAMINYEFLLAPAYIHEDGVVNSVQDLLMCCEHVERLSDPPLLEFDITLKMAEAALYPSVQLYRDRFAVLEDCPFSAEDVYRVVNNIIEKGKCISSEIPERIVEWCDEHVDPEEFLGVECQRKEQLLSNVEMIGLGEVLNGIKFSFLHGASIDGSNIEKVAFSGKVNEIFPELECVLPLEVLGSFPVFCSHGEFSQSLDPLEVFRGAQNDSDLKFSFYLKAKAIASGNGNPDSCADWGSFGVGRGFFSSLKNNQCAGSGAFGSVVLDTIAHVLAGQPKNEISIFATKAGSGVARSHGKYKAYRTHLTGGKQALRLMFWKHEDGGIVFANVGNKHELKIEKP